MPLFWNNVVFSLKVSGSLVCVLCLVDGERKPPMGYIYEAMDTAKEAISKSFKWDENRYEEIFRIIDIRWNIQLHCPLHGAGWFLNPEFFYSAKEVDEEVTNGLLLCIEKLVPNVSIRCKIDDELVKYKRA
ncbi:hypothetical protein Ddye_029738 [Dipteronia dyeriana]|uniref:Uncharacterized protein n=1 Tax=Dipteronia dyeriana TaxID=168575 RepID=A0AAD9TFC6_9ROSI|nr:hypothetical protein Ddye_029738 [Dipteronia dyeriana]